MKHLGLGNQKHNWGWCRGRPKETHHSCFQIPFLDIGHKEQSCGFCLNLGEPHLLFFQSQKRKTVPRRKRDTRGAVEWTKPLRGQCDPFVKLRVGPVEHTSQVIPNSHDPVWGHLDGLGSKDGFVGYMKMFEPQLVFDTGLTPAGIWKFFFGGEGATWCTSKFSGDLCPCEVVPTLKRSQQLGLGLGTDCFSPGSMDLGRTI